MPTTRWKRQVVVTNQRGTLGAHTNTAPRGRVVQEQRKTTQHLHVMMMRHQHACVAFDCKASRQQRCQPRQKVFVLSGRHVLW